MAVEVSVQQMALTRDTGPGGFMERVTAMLAFVTSTILSEAGTVAYHQQRAFYAQKVVGNPQQAATLAGPQVVMGVNVVAATTYDEIEKKATCTIADLDLQSQIVTLWNSLAGIEYADMIREATPEDVPIVVDMGCRQLAALYDGVIAQNPAQLAALTMQLITSPTGVVFVAERDGALVGMIGLVCYAHHLSAAPTVGEVAWWVEPHARGIGLDLLTRAERWAVEMGATQIQMVAPTERVGRLYARRGYVAVETSYLKPVRQPPEAAIIVLDDVLPDVDAYRARVLQQPFEDVETGPGVVFHGIARADDTLPAWIAARYPRLRPHLTFVRRSPAGQVEPNFIHTDCDMGEWTGIYYLTADPPAGDGTTFWRRRMTGDVASTAKLETDVLAEWDAWRDRDQWEPWYTVPAQLNRLVLFPAPYFHSRAIEENFGDADDARLIQVVFGSGAPGEGEMSVGTGTALAIGVGASVASNVASAKLKSNAANKAAKTQGAATTEAQRLQYQIAQQSLAAQAQQYARTQQLYSPYTQAAPQSLGALYSHLGIPQGGPLSGMGMPPPGMPPPGMPPGGPPPGGPPPGGPGGPMMARPRPWEGGMMPLSGMGGPPLPAPPGIAPPPFPGRPRQAPPPVPLGQFYRGRALGPVQQE